MFKLIKKSDSSTARVGILKTTHGEVKTPAYIFVGTDAEIRTLDSKELNNIDIQIIISNTYHLWRQLGDGKLESFQGLHDYMNWKRPLITDSGGFQVFSLGYAREFGGSKVKLKKISNENKKPEDNLVRVTEGGVYFKLDGKETFLDAKKSIWIQERLGADIILAFDEPSSPYHDYSYTKEAMERTHRWAKDSIKAKQSQQKLFGIVQGGEYQDLREESAKYINSLDFDGYSLGGAFGSSFGSKPEETFAEIDWMVPHLDEDKPRHLLGIGKVRDIFVGVSKGIDLFDCVIPTREARHGKLYTKKGEINIKNSKYKEDNSSIDSECGCQVCNEIKLSRLELRKLFKDKDLLAGKYATIHNIWFFANLMREIRGAVGTNSLEDLQKRYFKYY